MASVNAERCPLAHTEGCEQCGKTLTKWQKRWCSRKCNRVYVANHRYTQAKAAKKKAAGWWKCERCDTFTQSPEVNHVVPCKGKHGSWGCHHHQDNLEVLCRPCHLAITAEQREQGLI